MSNKKKLLKASKKACMMIMNKRIKNLYVLLRNIITSEATILCD